MHSRNSISRRIDQFLLVTMHELGVLVLDPSKAAPYRSLDLPLCAIRLVPDHSFPPLRFGVAETPWSRWRRSFIPRIAALVPRWNWWGDPARLRQISPRMPLHPGGMHPAGDVSATIAMALELLVCLDCSKPRCEVIHDLGREEGDGEMGLDRDGAFKGKLGREYKWAWRGRRSSLEETCWTCVSCPAPFGPKGDNSIESNFYIMIDNFTHWKC